MEGDLHYTSSPCRRAGMKIWRAMRWVLWRSFQIFLIFLSLFLSRKKGKVKIPLKCSGRYSFEFSIKAIQEKQSNHLSLPVTKP